ncbi:MAG: alkaline phosphatase family protein [Gemmatimonadota bacterium]
MIHHKATATGLGRVAAMLAAAAAGVPLTAQAPRPAGPVRYDLVVSIVVDQMRPDYFTRFQSQWTGGFKRFAAGGTLYLNGEQDHAITETAPGHSTVLSGRSPAATGIVTNDLGVPDSLAPLIGAPTLTGASPRRFRGTTLFDWMLAADPETRVLSVSRKDRGAILPIGRARVPVYWYAGGSFTTSTWYADSLPSWVVAWNQRKGPARLAGTEWTLLLQEAEYPEPDDQPYENGGKDKVFPHRVPDNAALLSEYPWMDSLTMDLALEGVRQLGLGARGKPDLLSISLSTTDAVGHKYGPDSRELHDHLLRLDRWLGRFMDSLATLVPRERILFMLTADHGVTSYPERTALRGTPAGRVSLDSLVRAHGTWYRNRYGVDFGFDHQNGLIFADVAALAARGVDTDSLARALAAAMARLPGVTRVYTPRTLAQAPASDLDAARWRRSIPADFGWLVAGSVRPGFLWAYGSARTGHGTTNPDDVRVPIGFLGAGIAAQRPDRVARTVDIGPTIAALLGIRPTEKVEGVPLREVTGAPR